MSRSLTPPVICDTPQQALWTAPTLPASSALAAMPSPLSPKRVKLTLSHLVAYGNYILQVSSLLKEYVQVSPQLNQTYASGLAVVIFRSYFPRS
jgi:hypothetical protein